MSLCHIFKSSIGKKSIMALSGLALLGFVFMHMIGNLLIFLGPEALNGYARMLQSLGEILWVARIVLLTMIVLHIWSGISVSKENREARPIRYDSKKNQKSTVASRTMVLSGLVILSYVIYHLLHFTFRKTNPEISHLVDSRGHHDVYSMVVLSFRQFPIAITYFISIAFLSMHLSHGISSALQTLGFSNAEILPKQQKFSRFIALIIFLGYTSIPAACWLGILKVTQ